MSYEPFARVPALTLTAMKVLGQHFGKNEVRYHWNPKMVAAAIIGALSDDEKARITNNVDKLEEAVKDAYQKMWDLKMVRERAGLIYVRTGSNAYRALQALAGEKPLKTSQPTVHKKRGRCRVRRRKPVAA